MLDVPNFVFVSSLGNFIIVLETLRHLLGFIRNFLITKATPVFATI